MNLKKPKDINIPFIAYGSFKPSELRYNLIEEYVQDYYEVKIIGLMEEKDGIPIFGLGNDGYYSFTYTAFVLNFNQIVLFAVKQKLKSSSQSTQNDLFALMLLIEIGLFGQSSNALAHVL